MNSTNPLIVATAGDENYVQGMAVLIRSVVATTPNAHLYVLDGGVTDRSKSRLARIADITWLKPDLRLLKTLPVSGWINHCTYLRLWLAELLDAPKAIYLDSDMIVTRNLESLWSTPLDGAIIAAVQDAYCPMLEPRSHWQLLCMRDDTDPFGIPNHKALGLNPKALYFNAGMFVADLDCWRRENVGEAAVRCLRDNEEHVLYWDQYALNVLFSERWKQLDHRWNQQPLIFSMSGWEHTQFSEAEWNAVRQDPWIVHFAYKPKPWQAGCNHPYLNLFFRTLDKTPWRWRRPYYPVRKRLAMAYEKYRLWRRERVSPMIRGLKVQLGLKRAA